MESTSPCNSLIGYWLLVEVALLLFSKTGFDHPVRD
jgi:hypothetical protein